MGGRDDFAVAFEAAFARLQVQIEVACASEGEWPVRVAAAIRAALEFAAADPGAARLLTSEALAHGKDGFVRYERMLSFLADRLAAGRSERQEGELPAITERAMTGGVASLIAQRVDAGVEGELPSLAPEAIRFVLTPYLGRAAAERVAQPS